MSDNYKVHRGELPPNDRTFIRSRRHNQNIWWAHRRWYPLAIALTWLMNSFGEVDIEEATDE
jgi:hypothetical protein